MRKILVVFALAYLSAMVAACGSNRSDELLKTYGGLRMYDDKPVFATVISVDVVDSPESGLLYYKLAVPSSFEPGEIGYFTQAIGPAQYAESMKVQIKAGEMLLDGKVYPCAFVVGGDPIKATPPAVSGLGSFKDKEVGSAK